MTAAFTGGLPASNDHPYHPLHWKTYPWRHGPTRLAWSNPGPHPSCVVESDGQSHQVGRAHGVFASHGVAETP